MPENKRINLSKTDTPMPVADPKDRINTFDEVEIGYTDALAKQEALRCLDCKHKPCVSGCPVGIDIPSFIKCIVNDDIDKANDILSKSSALPAVCGRVCPQEKQCQAKCVRGKNGDPVAIGKLERYAADNCTDKKIQIPKNNGCKIAVIGSGPSGITCARELAIMGYKVTIYEALHSPGGVMTYGIPEFRLPRDILDKEIHNLSELGVSIQTNVVIGKTFSIDELMSKMEYKAVYISTGAGTPKFMEIPGETLPGVYSANEFLTRINLMHAYSDKYDTPIMQPKRTVVIGGGNVAMDAARCAVRLNSDVTVVYRRSEEDMPARKEEILHAKEEGVKFQFLSQPIRIHDKNGKISCVECNKMKYTTSTASSVKKLSKAGDETFFIETDCVIIAIGSCVNSIIKENSTGVDFDASGKIIVNAETMQTSKPGVYAGGDAVTGSATVILAMEAGKKAAMNIHKDLMEKGEVFV